VHKTVGEVSLELSQKPVESQDPIELQREMTQDYLRNLLECVESFRETTMGDFYVIVITKNERLMPNVFRNYFTARYSCPTPEYDQAVYKFDSEGEEITLLWVIPSKDACIHLRANAPRVHESEKQLLQYVLDFADETLYHLSKKLNSESKETPLIVEG
jgi:hypothetical protein